MLEKGVAHFGDAVEEDADSLGLGGGDELDHLLGFADRQLVARHHEAVVVKQHLGQLLVGGLYAQTLRQEDEAGEHRGREEERALYGEGEAIAEDLRGFLGALGLAGGFLVVRDGVKDLGDVADLLEAVEPGVVVGAAAAAFAEVERVGALGRNHDVIVLAEVGAGLRPEAAPAVLADDVIGGEQRLEAADGGWAEAGERGADEFARLFLEGLRETLGVAVADGEEVVGGDGAERLGGVFERHRVARLAVEVDCHAAIEEVYALDLAKAPGLVEVGVAGGHLAEERQAAQRLRGLDLAELDAVNHADEVPVAGERLEYLRH